MFTLPNRITLTRIALTLLLYIPALHDMRTLLIAGFLITFATDILDGYLARKLNLCTHLGMRLDSFADYFLYASAAFWLWRIVPAIFTQHQTLWIAIAITVLIPQIIALIKLRTIAAFHLHTAKLAGWIAAALFLHAILTGAPSTLLLHAFALTVACKALQEVAICLPSAFIGVHRRPNTIPPPTSPVTTFQKKYF